MINLIKIKADDDPEGAEIIISAEEYEREEIKGYRLVASNGDDIGYYRPKSLALCRQDAEIMWGGWQSYEEIG